MKMKRLVQETRLRYLSAHIKEYLNCGRYCCTYKVKKKDNLLVAKIPNPNKTQSFEPEEGHLYITLDEKHNHILQETAILRLLKGLKGIPKYHKLYDNRKTSLSYWQNLNPIKILFSEIIEHSTLILFKEFIEGTTLSQTQNLKSRTAFERQL